MFQPHINLSTLSIMATSAAIVLTSVSTLAQPTAETPREIIDQLIAERDAQPTVAPTARPAVQNIPSRVGVPAAAVDLDASVIGVLPGAPLPRLRREGEFIIERPGQLISVDDSNFWVFAFDTVSGQPDLRPMIVQKCQRLASMQDTLDQRQGDDLGFTLTGQVHTYRGVNYLLPTAIAGTRKLPPGVNTDAPEPDEPAAPANNFDMSLGSSETPATFEGAGNNAAPDPIDLMESMLNDRTDAPRRPDTAPVASPMNQELDEALEGIKPKTEAEEKLLREGEYLVNRAGRLIRGIGGTVGGEAANVLFAFEADGQDPAAAEAPMLVMPCKLLELMEDTVVERGDQVVFLVSGRVYTYRGANYLMPSTMQLQYDLGNLKD